MRKKKVATPKAETPPIIRYRQVSSFDENGEVITSTLFRPHFENGSGFVLWYMSEMERLAIGAKQASVFRVLFYIAAHQQYGNDGVFGYRCSKKHLQDTLGIQAATLWSALKWLKENFIINEMQVDGVFEFMVNPDIATIGKEKKKRVKEWDRRCAEYISQYETKQAEKAEKAEKAAKEPAPANDAQAESSN